MRTGTRCQRMGIRKGEAMMARRRRAPRVWRQTAFRRQATNWRRWLEDEMREIGDALNALIDAGIVWANEDRSMVALRAPSTE